MLKINPSDVAAHVFLADQAIDAGKRPEARELLQKALSVNPSSLEARSLLAGLAYVEDKPEEFKAEVDRVLAIAPRYGEVYRVAGELLARNYRFEEAVAAGAPCAAAGAAKPAGARRPRAASAPHR